MKITVLGSGSAVPVPGRHSSAYIVQSQNNPYLIDAGDGVTQQLIQYKFRLDTIKAVFISHTHADHAAGIIMLVQTMQQIKRTAPLEMYIPDSVLLNFDSVFPYFQIYKEKLLFPVILKGISSQTLFEDNDFQIRAVQNDHLQKNKTYAAEYELDVSSFSFLITEKTTHAIYTSDINNFKHLRKFTYNTELLISECTHVSIASVKKFAETYNIKNVILSHVPPEIDNQHLTTENLSSDKVNMIISHDGQVFEV